MKKCSAFFFAFLTILQIQFAQVFWSEAFGSGAKNTSIDGLNTGNGAWDEVLNGTQGTKANSWFASKEECGNDPTECGSACASDASLHVGSVDIGFCAGGDCGAAYFASSTSKTDKDAISPFINTTGYSGITLAFNYIGYGEGTQDVASWSYSCDGGSTWTFVTNLTTNCCSGSGAAVACNAGSCSFLGCQGRWTAYSYSLPACADNISNFKIKFNWKNDNDNNGSDPSFAVDDITLSYLVLPIEITTFTAHEIISGVELNWSTQTESNIGHFVIERSFDGEQFISIGFVNEGESINQLYEFTDDNTFNGIRYYRLKQVDTDGNFAYSKIITIQTEQQHINYFAEQTPGQLIISSTQFKISNLTFELLNTAGNIISQYYMQDGTTSFILDLHHLPVGVYLLAAKNNIGENVFIHKFSKY